MHTPPPGPPPTPPPTAEWVPPSVSDPRAATELVPLPEERTKSALPWFVSGLVMVVLVGGGAWAGLRFLGDDLLGPLPTGDDLAARADAGPAGARPDAGTALAAAATKDAGVAGALAASGDAGPQAADPVADDAAAADAGAAAVDDGSPAADDPPDDGVADPVEDPPVADKPVDTTRKPPPAATGPSDWFDVKVTKPGAVAVKAKSGGTIASVDVADGDTVKRGASILTLEGGGGADADEISNVRESIESLEEIAESQPSAADMLAQEKAKLARLLAQGKTPKVVAPSAGTVSELNATVGGTVSAGDVVCTVQRSGSPTVTIQVPSKDGRRAKRGARVELELSSGGTADGKVKSSRRRGRNYAVTLDVGGASLDDVARARFP
jgi:biotin carboxyl carrier protein